MPFTTKKINMVIHSNSSIMQNFSNYNYNTNNTNYSNYTNNSNISSAFTGRSGRNVFNNPMLGRIQNIKGSGCSSCGGAK